MITLPTGAYSVAGGYPEVLSVRTIEPTPGFNMYIHLSPGATSVPGVSVNSSGGLVSTEYIPSENFTLSGFPVAVSLDVTVQRIMSPPPGSTTLYTTLKPSSIVPLRVPCHCFVSLSAPTIDVAEKSSMNAVFPESPMGIAVVTY